MDNLKAAARLLIIGVQSAKTSGTLIGFSTPEPKKYKALNFQKETS